MDCPICLQQCHHPTKLPCGHIFCFLCIKGVALQNSKCAMCRAEIPSNYFQNPVLLEKLKANGLPEDMLEPETQYQWYYEGRNGWWKYDERSNEEIETAYTAESKDHTLLVAGALYVIDFQKMIQYKRNDGTRRRRVRRDTPLLPAKGIAGIKIFDEASIEEPKPDVESVTISPEVVTVESDTDDEHQLDSDDLESPSENLANLFSSLAVEDEENS